MSVVYEVKCECGEVLDFSCKLDSSDDLMIEVVQCPKCVNAAYEDGEKEKENK